ncbi:LytTr DNA-binding domain protein [compost metagenome]
MLIVFLYLTNLFYLILYNDRKGSGELIAIRPERPPKRLFVHHQGHILPIDLMDIALIYQEHQINWLINFDGQSYAMETSLKQVQKELDGQRFFQINRWQIVNRENIRSLKSGTFGKIEVEFMVNFMKGTVSKGRASEFRKWLCM